MINISQAGWRMALLLTTLAASPVIADEAKSGGKALYEVDFSQQPDGSALEWLQQNHFVLGLDADELNPRFENHQLVISTESEWAGIFILRLDDKVDLKNVERVDIEWGVSRFPVAMNWEKGNNRVAIAVMVFFGTEKLRSGLPFNINAAPYFFSPFVAKTEPAENTYTGKLYKEGGRYFSVAAPADPASIFKTSFELRQRFQNLFHKQDVPAVSGVAFQMNTQNNEGGAVAAIRKITFVGQ